MNRVGSKPSRRDSVFPWNLPDRSASSSSSSSGDEEEVEDIKSRLIALEESQKRIEEMLGRLCANLPKSGSTTPGVATTDSEDGTG